MLIDKIRKVFFAQKVAKLALKDNRLEFFSWNRGLSGKYGVGMFRFKYDLMKFKLKSVFLGDKPHDEKEIRSLDVVNGGELLVSLDVDGNVGTFEIED